MLPALPLPRYFVADAGEPRPLAAPADAILAEVIDALVLGDARQPQACAVVRELSGAVRIGPEALAAADANLRPVLVQAEVVRGKPPRFVASAHLWCLAVEAAELPEGGDPVGAPVKLLGEVAGPFGGADTAHCAAGSLTVRRGDWLLGLLRGAADPFGVLGEASPGVAHALVPGGDGEATAAGRELVLAYPLLPVAAQTAGNAAMVSQMLGELLANLQQALRTAGAGGEFVRELLPVADRAAVETELRAQGFTITADTATRDRLFGKDDVVELPPQACLNAYLAAGESALRALGAFGYPDARARALHARVGSQPRAMASEPRIPSPSRPPPPRSAPSVSKKPTPPRPADWLADFADLPPPATGAKMPPPTAPATPPAAPDWLKDFE